ncbi:MAG: xanthine dehydrogenase family protein molybdopterin-binding subunit, partial [Chloroflexi bacterium]|nr:xanthine dehydrogenase family protein molybdopterin-binding subunit [Chloroflexota bacterium]
MNDDFKTSPVSRRNFLRLTGGAGAGLFVIWSQVACGNAAPAASSAAPSASPSLPSANPAQSGNGAIAANPSISSAASAAAVPASSLSPSAAPSGNGPKKVPVLEFGTLPPVPPPAGNWSYPKDVPQGVDSYLQIGQDGTVTLMTGKMEFGQGIMTGFAQLVAEELDVALNKVKVVMGQTNTTPFDIGTFGSLSTRGTGPTVRAAAAIMHGWLMDLGAAKLGVPAAQLSTKDGSVFVTSDPSKTATYASLANGQKVGKQMDPKNPPTMKDPSKFTMIGKTPQRVDLPDKVQGKAVYGYDARVDGMVYGSVLHVPSIGAKMTNVDTSAAEKAPGVVGVVHDGDFVGLATGRSSQLAAAMAMIKPTWQESPLQVDDKTVFDYMKAHHDQGEYVGTTDPDSAAKAVAGAAKKVSFRVTMPYLSHMPIEPFAALVNAQADKTEVWASTQDPWALQDSIANYLKVSHDKVIVYPLLSGGAFGRSSVWPNVVDVTLEALRLSQGLKKPVRVNWSRADDFMFDRFKPASLIEFQAGIDASGNIVGWKHDLYFARWYPAGQQTYRAAIVGSDNIDVTTIYGKNIQNAAMTAYYADSQFPTLVWRSNGGGVNALARESAVDQLAELAGKDPVAYRLQLLQQNAGDPRLSAVIQAAVKMASWTPGVGSTGKGYGIGATIYDGTYVAEVAQVAVDKSTGKVTVKHIDAAVDCGLCVNPTAAAYQTEGGIVSQGITSTLKEGITFSGGKVTNASFAQYGPATQGDAPSVTVQILQQMDKPMAAIGEPGVVPVSSAVHNAIYDAIGVRVYDLPFTPDRVLAAIKAGPSASG